MKKVFLSLVILVGVISAHTLALPQKVSAAVAPGCDKSIGFLELPTWYKYLDVGPKDDDNCAVIGPLDTANRFDWAKGGPLIGLAVIDILLRIGAMVAVGFVIYGGFRFILSQGEPESVKHARNTILNSVIGLVITIFATLVVNLIGGVLVR